MRIKIAIRNIIRNQGRTILNLFMISAGVVAVVIFKGFGDRQLFTLREGMIKSDLGHIQVATQAFWDQTEENPRAALLNNPETLMAGIEGKPGVVSVSGRIAFFGLISLKERTTSARGLGFDPIKEKRVIDEFSMSSGRAIKETGSGPAEIMLGLGLANKMRTKVGDTVTLITHTFGGVINAIDGQVSGIFQSGLAEIDNVTFIMSLSAVQKLLDTNAVEKIVVSLDSTELTPAFLNDLKTSLVHARSELQAKSWLELSRFYQEVADYYRVYNGMIRAIILSLILVGILNTVGMAIAERTGEIGTIRSLGETRRSVVLQFLLEGGLLGLTGALAGVVVASLFAWVLNIIKIPVTIPGATLPLPVEIELHLSTFMDAILLTTFTTVLASLIPSYRASRMDIVDALRRNI